MFLYLLRAFVRTTSVFLIFNLLIDSFAYAGGLPYDVAGQFDDECLQPKYAKRFGIRKVIALDEMRVFSNVRFFLDLEAKDTLPETIPHLERGVDKKQYDIRGDRAPDYPISWRALLMQRLFPSPDGMNLVPNQGSDQDPVSLFSPATIGHILNDIRDFEPLDPKNEKAIKAFENHLAQLANKDRTKKKRKAKLAARKKFGHLVRKALTEQWEHKSKKEDIYPPNFVECTLFNFALHKAEDHRYPAKQMLAFYKAMPDITRKGWKPSESFSLAGYQELTKKLGEKDYKFKPRERFALLLGAQRFSQIYPEEHSYSTSTYEDTTFPDCGEISLLNILNGFLWDFSKKRLRVEILEKMNFASKHLKAFFKTYDTTRKQQTREAKMAWARVVSGLKGKDIFYKKPRDENICEISGGARSMAGIVRALFPDERFKKIDSNSEGSPLQRTQDTMDHLVEIFSREKEKWSWKVAAKNGQTENNFDQNTGITIEFYKKGKNLAQWNHLNIIGPMMKWKFSSGHYVGSFETMLLSREVELYALKALEDKLGNHPTKFQERRFIESMSPLDFWMYTEHLPWIEVALHQTRMSLLDPVDEDNQIALKASRYMPLSLLTDFFRKGAFLTIDSKSSIDRSVTAVLIDQFAMTSLARFCANLFEGLPLGDPWMAVSYLKMVMNEKGGIRETPRLDHPRLRKRHKATIDLFKDSTFSYTCAITSGGTNETMQYMLEKMDPKRLTREQALKLMYEISEDFDYTPKTWEKVFARFGKKLRESTAYPHDFMRHRPDEKSDSLEEKILSFSNIKTLQYFITKRFITKETLLRNSENADVPIEACPLDKLLLVCKALNITKKDILEKAPLYLGSLFCSAPQHDEHCIKIVNFLKLTKKEFLSLHTDDHRDTVLFQMMRAPTLENRLNFFLKTFKINKDDNLHLAFSAVPCPEAWDLFIKRGLITKDFLFEDYPESEFNGTNLEELANYTGSFQSVKALTEKFQLTKHELQKRAPMVIPYLLQEAEQDLLKVVDFFKLTKDDFIKPPSDGRKAVLFEMMRNPNLKNHLELIIEKLEINKNDNIPLAFPAVPCPEAWDVLVERGLITKGLLFKKYPGNEDNKTNLENLASQANSFHSVMAVCKKLKVTREEILDKAPSALCYCFWSTLPSCEDLQDLVKFFKLEKNDFMKSFHYRNPFIFEIKDTKFVKWVVKTFQITASEITRASSEYLQGELSQEFFEKFPSLFTEEEIFIGSMMAFPTE